jgi:hypothetical protein
VADGREKPNGCRTACPTIRRPHSETDQRGESNMARDTDDGGYEHVILTEENRLGVWAEEGGYVPPACDEPADEPETGR